MKRKVLIGVLLGLIFLFWSVYPAQGQKIIGGRKIIIVYKAEVWPGLNPRQKEVGQILTKGIHEGFLKAFDEQEEKGIEFKNGALRIETEGDHQNGDLVVRIVLWILEPDGSTRTFTEEKVWEKCPEPNSLEVKKTINLLVKIAIFNLKVKPSQSLPKMPVLDT